MATVDELSKLSRIIKRILNTKGHFHAIACVFCLATADQDVDEKSWFGWTVTPYYECPDCKEKGLKPDTKPINLEIASKKFRTALGKLHRDRAIR